MVYHGLSWFGLSVFVLFECRLEDVLNQPFLPDPRDLNEE